MDHPTSDLVQRPCPACGATLTIAQEYIGRSGKCRYCGNRIRIPESQMLEPNEPGATVPDDSPAPNSASRRRVIALIGVCVTAIVLGVTAIGAIAIGLKILQSTRTASATLSDHALPPSEQEQIPITDLYARALAASDLTEREMPAVGNVVSEQTTSSAQPQTRVIVYQDGSTYDGEIRNDMRHGYGTMIWPSGLTYSGDWLMDKRTGFGEMRYPEGYIYRGQMLDGQRNGEGTMIWPNGQVYTGQWSAGKREGQGTVTLPDGFRYKGEWRDNVINGYGEDSLPGVGIYRGDHLNGKMHGYGRLEFSDGTYFEGEFRNGTFIGTPS